jgi:hypothetical protein
MKNLIVGLTAGAAALVTFAGAAKAAPWQQPINQREARIEMQIHHGVRTGALTRVEAARLSDRLYGVQRLEQNFRRGGLTLAERNVLDQRLDALERSIHVQMADGQVGYGRGFHRR